MEKNILKTKNHSIGISDIDAQHRRLNNLIGSLSGMCLNQEKITDIDFAIMVKQTLYFINFHIKYEEKLMEETVYPNLEEHKKFHNVFFMNFLKHITAFESRNQFNPENLPGFLYEWLDSHFLMDKNLGLHIRNNRKKSVCTD